MEKSSGQEGNAVRNDIMSLYPKFTVSEQSGPVSKGCELSRPKGLRITRVGLHQVMKSLNVNSCS